jgi:hypothetical protein
MPGDNWIQEAVSKNPGAFSRKAEKRDMTTSEFASKVAANPDEYADKTVKQASLAKTLSKLRRRKGK